MPAQGHSTVGDDSWTQDMSHPFRHSGESRNLRRGLNVYKPASGVDASIPPVFPVDGRNLRNLRDNRLSRAYGKHLRQLAGIRTPEKRRAFRLSPESRFRSSIRNWTIERTGADWTLGETVLAHRLRSSFESVYAQTDMLEQRRELMQQWADYLTG